MHEYSIVAALCERACLEAEPHASAKISRLRVSIGELAGVDPQLLATAWETFRAAGGCEDADLDVREVTAAWGCPSCGAAIAKGAVLRCARCQLPARLLQGDEITLDRVEMEVPRV